MTTVEMEQEMEIGVDMDKALKSMLEDMDNNESLRKFIYSLCEGFKQNIKEDISREEQIMLGIIVGWVGNDIYNNACKKIDFELFKPKITEILEKNENLVDYEAEFEDGSSFIMTTNSADISNEELKEIIEKQTGKKVVSELKKLKKEETQKMREKVIQILKEEKKETEETEEGKNKNED